MTSLLPASSGSRGRSRRATTALVYGLVVVATLGACFGALVGLRLDRELSVGTVRLSIAAGHRGALDIYVPLVDWGVRFPAVRAPVRLRVDVRTVDRAQVSRLATGQRLDVERVRRDARSAVASYLRVLLAVVAAAGFVLGGLVALAARGGRGPPVRRTIALAGVVSLASTGALALLLPPRGPIDRPEYYAHGPDIPRALRAIDDATASSRVIGEELNAQLVGLAQLVSDPAGRSGLAGGRRLTLASDLHNNVLALPPLERAAAGAPLFFSGDLTDRGSPLEARLVERVVEAGEPFVFVAGNHDSDSLAGSLARRGAVVLTERGRLLATGRTGDVVVRIAGLRVAGYADPLRRRASDGFRDRGGEPTDEQKQAFARWLSPLVGKVDVVMTHSPALIETALEDLRKSPPQRPLVFLVGHTHATAAAREQEITIVNGGSVGGGGTGNLAEGQPIGLAVLRYELDGGFRPLAADLVEIDPGSGNARANRTRLSTTGSS